MPSVQVIECPAQRHHRIPFPPWHLTPLAVGSIIAVAVIVIAVRYSFPLAVVDLFLLYCYRLYVCSGGHAEWNPSELFDHNLGFGQRAIVGQESAGRCRVKAREETLKLMEIGQGGRKRRG